MSSERGQLSIIGDAIHSETIKKELRYFKLHKEFMQSEKQIKSLVLTTKPTDVKTQQEIDQQVLKLLSKTPKKHTDFETPVTTSGIYGWDTKPLVHYTDKRFHHPKIVTDITTKYGTLVQTKSKQEAKDAQ